MFSGDEKKALVLFETQMTVHLIVKLQKGNGHFLPSLATAVGSIFKRWSDFFKAEHFIIDSEWKAVCLLSVQCFNKKVTLKVLTHLEITLA